MKYILDTDLGCDIDDTFALAYLLKRARKDIALVLADFGDTPKRVELIADYLGRCGCTEIPVGKGKAYKDDRAPYQYKLASFSKDVPKPVIIQDGIGEAIRLIRESDEPIVFIAIGPLTNLAELFCRYPEAKRTLRVVAMAGSVRIGKNRQPIPHTENNIVQDLNSSQSVFRECAHMEITPLDTCGDIYLRGDAYQKLLESKDPIIVELMKDFQKWLSLGFFDGENSTSCLYDTVATYMAFEHTLLKYEKLPIVVDDEGYTRISPDTGNEIDCAIEWFDQEAFLEHLLTVYLQ